MLIYSLLAREWAELHAASAAEQAAGYSNAPPAFKARTTRARSKLAAELARIWPEYGRKVDNRWWAGPERVSPQSEPVIVGVVSGGIHGDGIRPHDGGTFSLSGVSSERALYTHGPIGMLVADHRTDPYAVFGSPMLAVDHMGGRARYNYVPVTWCDDPISLARTTPRELAQRIADLAAGPLTETPGEYATRLHPDDWTTAEDWRGEPRRERGPAWTAAALEHRSKGAPGGMDFVGFVWWAAYNLRHGASHGYRVERDAIHWFSGPRAGEVERFDPLPFYPDEHQPPAMRGAPMWTPAALAI